MSTIDMQEIDIKARKKARRDILCQDSRFCTRKVENKKRKKELKPKHKKNALGY